jgi:hypothetical protein
MSIAAPLAGIALLSFTWNLNDAAWGSLALLLAGIAFVAALRTPNADDEIAHVYGAAAVVWALAGTLAIGAAVDSALRIDGDTLSLAIAALISIVVVWRLTGPAFVAAISVARVIAAVTVLITIWRELAVLFSSSSRVPTGVSASFWIAEMVAIAAGLFACRDMIRKSAMQEATTAMGLFSYVAFLLVDARLLGALWTPLVTASYAVFGTALLIIGHSHDNRVLRQVGGATIALVIGRLMFVDLAGVDTIWRVLLFLGCGALFLFTSHQMQAAGKEPPPGPA